MRKVLLLLLLSVAARGATDESLRLDLRGSAYFSLPDSVDQTAIYEWRFNDYVATQAGLRLSEKGINLSAVSYKGELSLTPLPFISVGARLLVTNRTKSDYGTTDLMFPLSVYFKFFDTVEFFGTIGWYERFLRLAGVPIIPRFDRENIDHDFFARVGLGVWALQNLRIAAEIASYDSMSLSNINSPFAGLSVDFQPANEPWTVYAYSRYRISLGFGRLDELMLGGGIKFPI